MNARFPDASWSCHFAILCEEKEGSQLRGIVYQIWKDEYYSKSK